MSWVKWEEYPKSLMNLIRKHKYVNPQLCNITLMKKNGTILHTCEENVAKRFLVYEQLFLWHWEVRYSISVLLIFTQTE